MTQLAGTPIQHANAKRDNTTTQQHNNTDTHTTHTHTHNTHTYTHTHTPKFLYISLGIPRTPFQEGEAVCALRGNDGISVKPQIITTHAETWTVLQTS